MRSFLLAFVFFLIGSTAFYSCKKDKTEASIISENCPDTISYTNQVQPWVNQSCATSGCHDATATGGYELNGYVNIAANADIILNVIRHDANFSPMPAGGGQIEDSLIQQFECWINQGKQDN